MVSVRVGDDKAMNSLGNLNSWLQKNPNSDQYYDKDYTMSTYIKGDFTDSLDYSDTLADSYRTKFSQQQIKQPKIVINPKN
ncbi:hypothetical protein D3C75_920290 [compost metagenome]